MSSVQPRIAIIGGGLGGLTFLLTLHRRGIPAMLYERDVSFSARAHLGGALDLGWESGQRALRENGLQDEFTKHSRPEGEELKIYDASGTLLVHHGLDEPPAPGSPDPNATPDHPAHERFRPEIDRTVLRKILLDALPPSSIKWDHALTAVRALPAGQHALTFANGLQAHCDLLVGADGAHSRVRALLSPAAVPLYTGVTGFEVSLAPSTAALPALAATRAAVGSGTMFAMRPNAVLASQPTGDGRIRTYALYRSPSPSPLGPGHDDSDSDSDASLPGSAEAARAALLERFPAEHWAPPLRALIAHCDLAAVYPRALLALPAGHRWAHCRGATLLGDAAHLMSPFSGAGANLAMLDALELGLALAEVLGAPMAEKEEGRDDAALDAAVERFEEGMCARAGRVAEKSMANLNAFVNPDAPASAIARFGVLAGEGAREG